MAAAIAALNRGEVARVVLTRPAVEAGEKLGFLPGTMAEKIHPYLRPLYDALHDMMPFEKTERMIERGTIEVAPLAFMRGRTLNNAFVILDEAQAIKNPSARQTKSIKKLKGNCRVAMTGTPVENRLGDLWSLFDFLNPGLLGSPTRFKAFAKSLESRTHAQYAPLRNLVAPPSDSAFAKLYGSGESALLNEPVQSATSQPSGLFDLGTS